MRSTFALALLVPSLVWGHQGYIDESQVAGSCARAATAWLGALDEEQLSKAQWPFEGP